MNLKPGQMIAGAAVGIALAGGGLAIAATSNSDVHGCINKKTRVLTVVAKCGKGTTAITWNKQGRTGARGKTGAGGAAATVSVGSVSTGAPGSQATVTNVGTANNAKLNFTIPQGTAGTNGTNGTNTGPTAYGEIWLGSSSAEVAPGNSHNIVGAGSDGVGGGGVDVSGCSSAGLTEPVINVTANHDPNDTLGGNTSDVADAYVSSWSTEPGTSVLVVNVDTTQAGTGTAVLSDFSITVNC